MTGSGMSIASRSAARYAYGEPTSKKKVTSVTSGCALPRS